MILGSHFFISPSDSLAMVAAYCTCIPYFKNGLTVFIYLDSIMFRLLLVPCLLLLLLML